MVRYLLAIMLTFYISDSIAEDMGSGEREYYKDSQRGWFWYETKPEIESEDEVEIVPAVTVPVIPDSLTPRGQLKKQGEEWEDILAKAILDPSRENYLEYMRQTQQITEQSQVFADGFKKTIWENPAYDYTLENPVKSVAIRAKNEQQNIVDIQSLDDLAASKGLLFFFRSDCPFCHKFGPIFKRFISQYGFETIDISLDGVGLPDFPNPRPDVELGRQLKVTHVPAVYMLDPDTNSVASVSFGFSDWTEFEKKILYAGQQINASR